MKVAIITTVNHNVGDDFVRDGIIYLLRAVLGTITPSLIHKHLPITVRSEWGWIYKTGLIGIVERLRGGGALRLSGILDKLPLMASTDKILSSDLVVQSGAPVYWLNEASECSRNEWYGPLIDRRWSRVSNRVMLLNIGAGACQKYDSDGSEFISAKRTLNYIREFHSRCSLTTVRDRLSKRILEMANLSAPLIPCPSIFARKLHGIDSGGNHYIALNYMRLGGHYKLDNRVGEEPWRGAFSEIVRSLSKLDRCILVCHDRKEFADAKRWFPSIERFYSRDYRDYLKVYSRASCGLMNRVHGAFALASFGKPSIVVGNDSRARMAEMVGMPSVHVARVDPPEIVRRLLSLQSDRERHLVSLARLVDEAEGRYRDILGTVLGRVIPNG